MLFRWGEGADDVIMDHIFETKILTNVSHRPIHDICLHTEHVRVAEPAIRDGMLTDLGRVVSGEIHVGEGDMRSLGLTADVRGRKHLEMAVRTRSFSAARSLVELLRPPEEAPRPAAFPRLRPAPAEPIDLDPPPPLPPPADPPPAPLGRPLGCPKCRWSPRGCAQCKDPAYRSRTPRPPIDLDPAPPAPPAAPAAPLGRPLGCPKCRWSPRGCAQCKNPAYRPRTPRPPGL